MDSRVSEAIKALRKGGIIVYPTETLYGLGADINNEAAVKRIYELKGRQADAPVSIAVAKEEVMVYAEVSDAAERIIRDYLPGPVALLLKKKGVHEWITKNEYVGIRVPDNPIALGIVEEFGPIVSTSANKSGEPAAHSVEDISREVLDNADYVIDAGPTKYKGPSTILRVDHAVEVVRQGVFDAGKIQGSW